MSETVEGYSMMDTSVQTQLIAEPRVYRRGTWAKLVAMIALAGGIVCASLLACANSSYHDEADLPIIISSSSVRAHPPNDVDPGGYGPRAGYGADDPGGPADPSAFAASHPENVSVPAKSTKRAIGA